MKTSAFGPITDSDRELEHNEASRMHQINHQMDPKTDVVSFTVCGDEVGGRPT